MATSATTANAESIEDEIHEYGCPYCDYTAKSEREVRVHISRSNKGIHTDLMGFSSTVYVNSLDKFGNEIEGIAGNPDHRKTTEGEVSTIMESESLTDKQEAIVRAALLHPDASVGTLLDKYIDIDVSKTYVSRILSERFGPARVVDDKEGYEDLTDKQQAIVDYLAEHYSEYFFGSMTQQDVADATETSLQYVGNVAKNFKDIIDDVADSAMENNDATRVRRMNGTGSYEGPAERIDATMQHISERPVVDGDAGRGKASSHSEQIDQTPGRARSLADLREKVALLLRLADAENSQIDASAVLAEVSADLDAVMNE